MTKEWEKDKKPTEPGREGDFGKHGGDVGKQGGEIGKQGGGMGDKPGTQKPIDEPKVDEKR